MEAHPACTQSFGEEHFGQADLGDRRCTRRLIRVADAFLAHPGGSLPDKCGDPAMYQGLLGLADADAVTHAAVLRPHLQRTLSLLREAVGQTILILHDITELDFTSRTTLAPQLGFIGDGRGRGYECFNSLAVRADSGEALGLVYQELFRRCQAPPRETKAHSRQRATRQSRLWLRGPAAVPPAPPGCRWAHVFDAEGETTEALEALQRAGQSYVTRSQSDRNILLGHAGAARGRLYAHARGLAKQWGRVVAVGARPGRPARQASCAVAAAAVRLVPPRQARGEHGRGPLPVWVVRVWEEAPPEGAEPLEWLLLSGEPSLSRAEAFERVGWYERRWVIEEYHKAQKTGCAIEGPQLEARERLEPVLAVLSVVAVQLLRLRDLGRSEPTKGLPATAVFAAVQVEVLSLHRYGRRRELTVEEFLYALARLGGHLNRRRDGPPGWLVLWRGWMKLRAMVDGALLVRDPKM
jgi:hypothetical protein